MPEDLRIRFGFLDHPKTKRMINRFGMAAVGHLFSLWEYVARFSPKGEINGISESDLEDVCRFKGQPGSLFAALIDEQWIDAVALDGKIMRVSIHDWKDNQPWVFFSPERSKKAKKSAEMKWDKYYAIRRQNAEHSQDVRTCDAYAPTPTPTPTPTPKTSRVKTAKTPPDPIPETVAAYRETMRLNLGTVQRQEVEKTIIGEGALELWKSILKTWALKGWNPRNIDGMLDCFRKGGITNRDESGLNQTQKAVMESRRRRLERGKNGDDGHGGEAHIQDVGGIAGQEDASGSGRYLPGTSGRHPGRSSGESSQGVPAEMPVLPDDSGDQGAS